MDSENLIQLYAQATPELTEVLAQALAEKEHALQAGKENLAHSLTQEKTVSARGRETRERLARLKAELTNLQSEACDAAIADGENFLALSKRHVVMEAQINLTIRALKLHDVYATRDAKRAVLVAQRNLAEADYNTVSAEKYLTLNRVFVVMKDQAAIQGGEIVLDAKALNTGRVALLSERLRQLARIQTDWEAALEKHDTATADVRRELELQGESK